MIKRPYYLFKCFIYLAPLIIMIFVISGCGQDVEDPISSDDSKSSLFSIAGAIPWSDPVDDMDKGSIDSLKNRAIKIGLILEADDLIDPFYGAELAMFEINREGGAVVYPIKPPGKGIFPENPINGNGIIGGFLGYPIALVIRDNKNDPALSEEAALDLIDKNGVVAIIGPGYSSSAMKVAQVAQRAGVPMVTTTATSPDVTSAGNYVFMAAFTDTFQGQVMARFAIESLKAQTAAIMTQEGDPYTEGLSTFFENGFKSLGGNIVSKQTFNQGDTDFTSQLEAIAEVAPEVIFMPGFTPEVPLAIKQARTIPQKNSSGISATFLGGDGWVSPDLVALGGSEIEGSYYTTFFSTNTTDANARDFIKSYQSFIGASPTPEAAMGYDALKLVATAIRRAGVVDKEAIRDQLAATSGYLGATYIQNYDANRHPIKNAVIMKIQNGRSQFYKQIEP